MKISLIVLGALCAAAVLAWLAKKFWWDARDQEGDDGEELTQLQKTVIEFYQSRDEVELGITFARIHGIPLPTELLKELVRNLFRAGRVDNAAMLCKTYSYQPAPLLRSLTATYPRGVPRWESYALICSLHRIQEFEELAKEDGNKQWSVL